MMYVFSDVLEIYHLKDIAYDLGLYDYKWWVMSLIVTICGQAIMYFQNIHGDCDLVLCTCASYFGKL